MTGIALISRVLNGPRHRCEEGTQIRLPRSTRPHIGGREDQWEDQGEVSPPQPRGPSRCSKSVACGRGHSRRQRTGGLLCERSPSTRVLENTLHTCHGVEPGRWRRDGEMAIGTRRRGRRRLWRPKSRLSSRATRSQRRHQCPSE